MTLPNADDGPGFRIAYAIVFGIIFLFGLHGFIKSFQLKIGKLVHLILFGMVTMDGLFLLIGSATRAQAIESPDFQTTPLFLNGIYLQLAQYGFQNAIIVQLLFMWIELFTSVQYGNFVVQEKMARRYAIVRNLCIIAIWLISFLLLYVPLATTHSLDVLAIWFSFIPVGFFILPILIIAAIRWRSLYVLMKECLKSHTRNGDRFLDITKATICGIITFLFDNIYDAATQGSIESEDVLFYLFLSLIPNAITPIGVIYFFSPMRKRVYPDEKTIPTSDSTGPHSSSANVTNGSSQPQSGSVSVEMDTSRSAQLSGDYKDGEGDSDEETPSVLKVDSNV